MFFHGIGVTFVLQQMQGLDNPEAGPGRFNDIINIAPLGSDKRIDHSFSIFLLFLFQKCLGIVSLFGLSAIQDFHRTLGAHYGNFSGGPGIVDVAAQMLGRHDAVGAAVCLAGDDRNFGNGGFSIGIEHFSAVPDDAAVFLHCTRQKSRHIDKGDHRDIKAVAETDKSGTLHRRVNIKHAGQVLGLVGDDTDRVAIVARKADDQVRSKFCLDFQEITMVNGPFG